MSSQYFSTIISNKEHKCYLTIEIKGKKIHMSSCYYVDYFKTTFENDFTLEQLQQMSDFYKQFQNEMQVLNEIRNNPNKKEEQIIEGDNPNEICLIIKFAIHTNSIQKFPLVKKQKTKDEILAECQMIIKIYESKLRINDINSKILKTEEEKESLKAWINPYKSLKAVLLYSYTMTYPEKLKKGGLFSNSNFQINKNVNEFHNKCDNKYSILVLCKSGTQTFGGYTPLYFSSNKEYQYDNNSFLFSLNDLKKYPKRSLDNTESIWGYKTYGPCFWYDLQFKEETMSVITSERKNYLIPEDFIGKKKCIVCDGEIYLDTLEIYQIFEYRDRY